MNAEAQHMDQHDTFQPLTHLFDIPLDKHGKKSLYFISNSLGPKPKSVEKNIEAECHAWAELGARGNFYKENPWTTYSERVIPGLARLVGATENEVIAANTLTNNIHLTFSSFYYPTRERFKVIRLAGFPSDTYAIDAQVQQRLDTIATFTGTQPFTTKEAVIEIKSDENNYISLEKIKNTLDEHGNSTAIVWIEAVHYLTGQFFPIAEIVRLAHEKGCKVGLDLAHAIGSVPLSLHEWHVDFAVWCNNKYVSAGPGAVGGLYIHEKYATNPKTPRLAGWWGHNKSTRFQMLNTFDPILGAEGWQHSKSSVFSLSCLYDALTIFNQVDLIALREKNKRLLAYLEKNICSQFPDIHILTPKNPDERGSHLAIRISNANPKTDIKNTLYDQGVICDVRGDVIRFAVSGLYTTFTDMAALIEKLDLIVKIANMVE